MWCTKCTCMMFFSFGNQHDRMKAAFCAIFTQNATGVFRRSLAVTGSASNVIFAMTGLPELRVIEVQSLRDIFGTTQFSEAELIANSVVEKIESAPPERLHLRYATGEAIILGRGLRQLTQLLQRGELENIRLLDRRYARTLASTIRDGLQGFGRVQSER